MADNPNTPTQLPSTTNGGLAQVVTEEVLADDGVNDAAIRLWQIDQALLHLGRNQGILGLGANAVQQSLKAEKAEIVDRLRALGEEIAAFDQTH